jgi:hypothetical protein
VFPLAVVISLCAVPPSLGRRWRRKKTCNATAVSVRLEQVCGFLLVEEVQVAQGAQSGRVRTGPPEAAQQLLTLEKKRREVEGGG